MVDRTYKISDLCELVTDTATEEFMKDKFVKLYDVPSYDSNRLPQIIRGNEIGSSKYIVPKKSILISKLNIRIPRIWVIDDSNNSNDNALSVCSTEFLPLVVNEEIIDFDYFYALISSGKIINRLINASKGTSGSHQRYSPNFFMNLEVKIPDKKTQKRIGNDIKTISDKINLNEKSIETCEEYVKVIFHKWFNELKFPLKDGTVFQENSNNIEYNSGKKYPDIWEYKNTRDIVNVTDYVANGSFASLKKNVSYVEKEDGYAILVRLIDYKNNFKEPFVWVDKNSYDFLKKSKLEGGEIVISNVGSNAGTVFRVPVLGSPMTLGPNSIVLEKNKYNNYLYYYFSSNIGQKEIQGIIGGSGQPKFNKTGFRALKIVVPNEETIEKFNELCDPIICKIELLKDTNITLNELKGLLIKKLIK